MARGDGILAGAVVAGLVLASAGAALAEQTLQVSTPSSFKMVWSHATPDGAMKMMEFVPEEQTVENWQQMITIQHFPKLAGATPSPSLAPGRSGSSQCA